MTGFKPFLSLSWLYQDDLFEYNIRVIVNTRVNIHETNNYGKTNVTGMSNPSTEWFLKTLHRERQQKKKKQPMKKTADDKVIR